MVRKWVLGVIAAIAVISVGGVGFAAFSSSITASGIASGGKVTIEWSGVPSITTSGGAVTCTATSTNIVLTITVGALAPGDSCAITDGIINQAPPSNLAAIVSSEIAVTPDGLACTAAYWSVSDSFSTTPSPTVEPGGSITDTVVVGLSALAPSACSDGHAAFTDTVTGTATG